MSEGNNPQHGGISNTLNIANRAFEFVQHLWISLIRIIHGREFLAEMFATFMLVTVGNGAVAQVILGATASTFDFGSQLSINLGYGLGGMIGAFIDGGVTGAHMNPAVTLAMALRGKLNWLKVLPYWLSQLVGAFLSAVMIYWVYYDALMAVDCHGYGQKSVNCTAGIWAPYPQPYLSLGTGFMDQFFGTFLLLLGIFGITDTNNNEAKQGMKPVLVGLLITAIGLSYGLNCGYAINPARDFGPRFFTAIAGWGWDVFVCVECVHIRQWWWVPVVAPLVGASAASLVYWLFIEVLHPKSELKKNEEQGYKPVQTD
uniref:Aquaporin related protein n=1 Tax=Lubomirskia baikalensis TaxID=289074 RepID=A4Q8S7_9METZ|nr:aquaporin related protein [Lubomirskia baikalensis]